MVFLSILSYRTLVQWKTSFIFMIQALYDFGETIANAGTLLVGRASEIVDDYLDDGSVAITEQQSTISEGDVAVEEPKRELERSASEETPKKDVEVPESKKEEDTSEKSVQETEATEQEMSLQEQESKDSAEVVVGPNQSTETVSKS